MPTVASRARPQAPMLGVAVEGFDNAYAYDRILSLGVKWVRRYRELGWRDVEPKEGQYNWASQAELEKELLRAQADGVEPIINIQMTPDWAQGVPGYACGPIRRDKFEAFAQFMEQVVKRYGTGTRYDVRYWQIGNEPDVSPKELWGDAPFGCWGDPKDYYYGGAYYADMLKVVYPRIKAADKGSQVMMAGLLLECDPEKTTPGNGCRDELRWQSGRFLEGVLKYGGGPYFDILDVHSYAQLRMDLPQRMYSWYSWSDGAGGGTGLPEKVAFVRDYLSRYGFGDKPVFAGEIALRCMDPTPECYEVAAAFVPRVYAEANGLGLVGATYYALITEFHFKGLLLPDFTPKPAYWAYKFLGGELSNATYTGSVNQYPGVTVHSFRKPDTHTVWILWSSNGEDVSVNVPAGFLAAYDRYGKAVAPANGHLTATWSPIYIEIKGAGK